MGRRRHAPTNRRVIVRGGYGIAGVDQSTGVRRNALFRGEYVELDVLLQSSRRQDNMCKAEVNRTTWSGGRRGHCRATLRLSRHTGSGRSKGSRRPECDKGERCEEPSAGEDNERKRHERPSQQRRPTGQGGGGTVRDRSDGERFKGRAARGEAIEQRSEIHRRSLGPAPFRFSPLAGENWPRCC